LQHPKERVKQQRENKKDKGYVKLPNKTKHTNDFLHASKLAIT
jgi:hypothetical protein